MLFFLRKLVEALMMPIGFSVFLLILGLVLRRRAPMVAAILVLCIPSTQLVSHLLLKPLESYYPAQTVADAPHVDAVVVLSGSILRGISPAGVQWGECANRYFAGLDLALAQKATLLVLSAGEPHSSLNVNQGSILRQIAISRGFPGERIIVTRPVLTTEDEASAISHLAGIHSILLVTSAFHMPRAVMLFRSHGMDVSPFPTDQRVTGRMVSESVGLIPDSSPLHSSELAIREYYGLVVYKTLLFFHAQY
jgi:uncharacterized SAM-binding protein YcdF (DUF218 family)